MRLLIANVIFSNIHSEAFTKLSGLINILNTVPKTRIITARFFVDA